MKNHGKEKFEKLPPSIKNRESVIFDPTKEVPDAIKVLDQKKQNARKRYQLKYQLQDEWKVIIMLL